MVEPTMSEIGALDLPAGTRIGAYEIAERIAIGGMGVVYKAHDVNLKRPVALKIIHPAMARMPQLATRFLWEAQVVARLEHENIVRIYAAGKSRYGYYICMQFFNGEAISKIIRHHGPLPYEVAIRVAKQVASALHVAHRAGIIHRDLNCNNILLNSACHAIVTDFGLSETRDSLCRMTGNSENYFMGTPEYASPEQWQNEDVNELTDIYSLGVSLYEMLSGHLPYRSSCMTDLAAMIANGVREPLGSMCPHIPPSIVALVDTMMKPNKKDRIQSAMEVVRIAERIIASLRARATDIARDESKYWGRTTSALIDNPQERAKSKRAGRREKQAGEGRVADLAPITPGEEFVRPAQSLRGTKTQIVVLPRARRVVVALRAVLRKVVKKLTGKDSRGDGMRKAAAF